jgi:hypothetical protein
VLNAIDEGRGEHGGMRGINSGFDRLNRAAGRIARHGAEGDITGNLVEVMKARHEVKANVAVVRVADETIGTLIDLLA